MLRSKEPSEAVLALPYGSQELLLGRTMLSIFFCVDQLTLEDNASLVCLNLCTDLSYILKYLSTFHSKVIERLVQARCR